MLSIETKNRLHEMAIRLHGFVATMKENKKYTKVLIASNLIYIIACINMLNHAVYTYGIEYFNLKARLVTIWILAMAIVIYILGSGHENKKCQDAFKKIGFKNKTDCYPILITKEVYDKYVILTFDSQGIPYDIWQDNLLKIENVLNITIADIDTGKRDDEIVVVGCIGKYDWQASYPWEPRFMPSGDKLSIGEAVGESISVDLNTNAHILIGGMTGSGKTILLKQLLLQCIVKGYEVYVADFKMGVDYADDWKKKCVFLTTRASVIESLKSITDELDNRLNLFAECSCKDIDKFNSIIDGHLDRVVFACDELAELLDTTGMDKDEKAQIKEIEGHLSKIARLGRAVGIHLILSTQRPDADVLNGQIKSNMTYRLCGRANEVLSRIILDSTDAAKQIPKDTQGVFINQDGMRIKGYDIRNDDLYKSLHRTTIG